MIQNILVPLDGSQLAEGILPHLVATATAFRSQVVLIHVLEQPIVGGRGSSLSPLEWQIRKTESRTYMERIAAQMNDLGVRADCVILEGIAADRIVEYAHTHPIDMLILTRHGQTGLSGWNVSSTVQKIMARVYMPTLIVPGGGPAPGTDFTQFRYRRLLVPLDGSNRGEFALPFAISLASQHGAQLVLAHIVGWPEFPQHLPVTPKDLELTNQLVERSRAVAERYIRDIQARLPLSCEMRVVVKKHVALALHDLVEEEQVDLLVLSAHGYSGISQWPYGSVALNFIAYGEVPLMVIQDFTRQEQKPEPGTNPLGRV